MKRLLFALALIASPAMAAPTFPELQGKPLLDAADIIPLQDEAAINERLLTMEKKSSHQVMILTVPSLEGYSIEDYGVEAGRHYKVGNRDSDDGILVTIAPKEHKTRIDTGYGMGSLLTDYDASRIIQDGMIPEFKNDNWTAGVNAAIDGLADKIVPLSPEQLVIKQREAAESKARAQRAWNSFTDFLSWVFMIGVGIAGSWGLFRLATLPKRRRLAREQAEREEAQRVIDSAKRAEAARQFAEDRRLEGLRRAEQQRIEEAARVERVRVAREREAATLKARQDMLAAMTPEKRAAFLKKERDDAEEAERRARDLARHRAEARQIEEARQAAQKKVEDEERAARRKRDEDNSRSSSNYGGYGGSYGGGYSSPSPSSYDGGSSTSGTSDWGGGGGSFGGGGSSGSWD